MTSGRVRFLIVGAPRSGTTLVQRLATELAGVAVPFETHFFTKGMGIVAEHGGFPLRDRALDDVLREYTALDVLRGSDLRADVVRDTLGGSAAHALALFDAIVATAAGPHDRLGEKTPGHAAWARRLVDARADLGVIGVVRDPRAVVASRREVPWGGRSVDVPALRWLDTQRRLVALAEHAPDRTLLLRYEDVVASPETARASIATLLDVPAGVAEPAPDASPAPAAPGLPWETWKARAADAPATDRIDRWQDVLSPREAARVVLLTAPMLERFGYHAERPTGWAALRARWSRGGRRRTAAIRAQLEREHTAVARAALGTVDEGDGPPTPPR